MTSWVPVRSSKTLLRVNNKRLIIIIIIENSHISHFGKYWSTGWGKITSLNFKVNNKKPIRGTKILFLDSETTTWEVLNYIVLKRISCKWWPLFACRAPGRLQNGPSDSLDVLWCSRGPWSSSSFSDTLPVSLKFSTHNRMDFRSGTRSRGGDLVASTERTLHSYDRVTAKSRFRRQMRAARWTTPSLRLAECCNGNFPTTCTFRAQLHPSTASPPFTMPYWK